MKQPQGGVFLQAWHAVRGSESFQNLHMHLYMVLLRPCRYAGVSQFLLMCSLFVFLNVFKVISFR